MDIYIDFDGVLFDTTKLKLKMAEAIGKCCLNKQKNKTYDYFFEEAMFSFEEGKPYDVYGGVCLYFSNKYGVNYNELKEKINTILENSNDLLYVDSIDFLEKLSKKKEYKLFILSHASKENNEFQTRKIMSCNLNKYFDEIIICNSDKAKLDIDYKNGIFIDDSVDVLTNLKKVNANRIIRIRRENNVYSLKELEFEIEEYKDLESCKI